VDEVVARDCSEDLETNKQLFSCFKNKTNQQLLYEFCKQIVTVYKLCKKKLLAVHLFPLQINSCSKIEWTKKETALSKCKGIISSC